MALAVSMALSHFVPGQSYGVAYRIGHLHFIPLRYVVSARDEIRANPDGEDNIYDQYYL